MGINDNQSIGTRLGWINYMVALDRKIDRISRNEYKLNVTQSRILMHIALHGMQPIGDVASELYLKASTITASMDILENKGFVTRSADNKDKRHVFVDITDKGREVAPHYIFILQDVFGKAAKELQETSYPELLTYVQYFNNGIISFDDFDKEAYTDLLSTKIDSGLNKEELELHTRRTFIIETISCFLAKASVYDRKSNLSINEGRILRTLGNSKKGLRLSAISEAISIRPNVATVSVTALINKGLVRRDTDPFDRRAASVTLTREGKKLLSNNNPAYCKIFDALFPGLNAISIEDYLV